MNAFILFTFLVLISCGKTSISVVDFDNNNSSGDVADTYTLSFQSAFSSIFYTHASLGDDIIVEVRKNGILYTDEALTITLSSPQVTNGQFRFLSTHRCDSGRSGNV